MRALLFVLIVPVLAHATPSTAVLVEGKPIPAELARAVPVAGVYISGSSQGSQNGPENFYIAYLDAKGLHEVFRAAGDFGSPYGRDARAWVDATHLITIDGMAGERYRYTVFTVSGTDKPTTQELSIDAAEWHLHRGEKLQEYESALLVTAKDAWFGRCMEERRSQCRYMRIWGGDRVVATRKPRHVIPARTAMIETSALEQLGAIPVPPAPKGYRVTVKPHEGKNSTVTCTGPNSKHVTPDDDEPADTYTYGYYPTAWRWVVTNPPIFAVKGTYDDPVAERHPLVQYRRACGDALGDIRVLRPRIWGELTYLGDLASPYQMVLHIDDVEIGRVAGADHDIAVSPPP
jgi:hypothetical protein